MSGVAAPIGASVIQLNLSASVLHCNPTVSLLPFTTFQVTEGGV